MSTTTVTGTGRRLSIRQSNWQPHSKTMIAPSPSSSTTSPLDKFPPFEDASPTSTTTPNGRRFSHSQRDGLNAMWQSRQSNHITWQQPNGLDISKHRPRKSISDAITTIRTRNASMSANAQELAEALKAPVSYSLTVSNDHSLNAFPVVDS
jgi:solute carrier family 35 protein E1